jgi:predicted dehydrogenase
LNLVNTRPQASTPSNSPRPAIAVIGCGRWGRNIVRDLLALDCEVVAIDITASARRDAIALGASSASTTLGEYTDLGPLDGVVIAASTRNHTALASEVLTSTNVPVFVEKPMAHDVATARALVELGSDRLFVMHKWSYHPGIIALADAATGGEVGNVHGVTSERVGPANPSDDTDILSLLGPHEITIGARIHGQFPTRVEAVADVARGEIAGIDVIARWDDDRWHRWTISTRNEPNARKVLVHGTAGYAVLDDPHADHITVASYGAERAAPHHRVTDISTESPLRRELQAFRDFVQGGAPPPTPAAHGLAVAMIIAEIRQAARLTGPKGSKAVRWRAGKR